MERQEKKQRIMLEQFTWQQFLVAALIGSLIWYAAVVLLYYRRDISKFPAEKSRQQPESLQREWEEEPREPGEEALMGGVREPDGASSLPMEALRFAPKAEDEEARLGAVPDVLEELKTIFSILEKEGGTKEDFISLFALVSAKYPQIKDTPSQRALNEHIRAGLLFPISNEELDQLWT